MNLNEALKAMIDGKQVRNCSYQTKHRCFFLKERAQFIYNEIYPLVTTQPLSVHGHENDIFEVIPFRVEDIPTGKTFRMFGISYIKLNTYKLDGQCWAVGEDFHIVRFDPQATIDTGSYVPD